MFPVGKLGVENVGPCPQPVPTSATSSIPLAIVPRLRMPIPPAERWMDQVTTQSPRNPHRHSGALRAISS